MFAKKRIFVITYDMKLKSVYCIIRAFQYTYLKYVTSMYISKWTKLFSYF